MGVSRASWYRHHAETGIGIDVAARGRRPIVAQKDRYQPAALSAGEEAQIVALLSDEDTAQLNVAQVRARAMDRGIYLASVSTWYRIARKMGLCGDRRASASHPPKKVPVLCAERPNQVWSWDVTVLPTIDRGRNLRLYTVLDVYSRATVGWRLENDEKGFKAVEMLIDAFGLQRAKPEVLHADRGSIMTGSEMSEFLTKVQVVQSHSRPQVSNDNPFSEAQFKTMKYCLDYPRRFTDLAHARAWVNSFVEYYNHEHHHSGIGYYTPGQVHDGSWIAVRARRQVLLDAHYAQYPRRYRTAPVAPTISTQTWINKPVDIDTETRSIQTAA